MRDAAKCEMRREWLFKVEARGAVSVQAATADLLLMYRQS
jgi:hypothetical protein